MIPVYVTCSTCRGDCHVIGMDAAFPKFGLMMVRCSACDGLGREWAPGAPSYGCKITLADRVPGEIVTLGNGQRGRILWHMPRKARRVTPETTFLGMIAEFTDEESLDPVAYPSCIGVLSVDVARASVDHAAHDGERAVDPSDPIQGREPGMLI